MGTRLSMISLPHCINETLSPWRCRSQPRLTPARGGEVLVVGQFVDFIRAYRAGCRSAGSA